MFINIVISLILACICVVAVLNPRIKTSSLEVASLGIIFIGAMINLSRPYIETCDLVTRIGVLCYALSYTGRILINRYQRRRWNDA